MEAAATEVAAVVALEEGSSAAAEAHLENQEGQ